MDFPLYSGGARWTAQAWAKDGQLPAGLASYYTSDQAKLLCMSQVLEAAGLTRKSYLHLLQSWLLVCLAVINLQLRSAVMWMISIALSFRPTFAALRSFPKPPCRWR